MLIGSLNIRKLGSTRSRSNNTREFLADICGSFDLLAVQEIVDDLSGLRRLMSLLGPEFSMVVPDKRAFSPESLAWESGLSGGPASPGPGHRPRPSLG